MKEVIVQNKLYEIAIDHSKNRVYLKIIGFWRNKEQAANYVGDLKNALLNVKPGFTLLTDLTEMKIHPADVQEIHKEAQNVLVSSGLAQTAEVLSSLVVQVHTSSISKKSNMPLKQFNSREEAELYLDNI